MLAFSDVNFGCEDMLGSMSEEDSIPHEGELISIDGYAGFGAPARDSAGGAPSRQAPARRGTPAPRQSAGGAFLSKFGDTALDATKEIVVKRLSPREQAAQIVNNYGLNKKVLWIGGGVIVLGAAYYFMNRQATPKNQIA